MGLRYQETYQVPFYESDITNDMKLPVLLSLALQISGKQSLSLGMSDVYVLEQYQLVWVVTDYDILIERLPQFNETITIETEAIAHNKIFCYRDFIIYGEDDNQIITIHATFVLMDINTRKVQPVLEEIVHVYQSEKIKGLKRGIKYQDLEKAIEKDYPVTYYDLDLNQHVNNGKYIEWFYDILGKDFLQNHRPKRIQLKYIKEIHYGQTVTSRMSYDDKSLESAHDIISDGQIHAKALITWQERKYDL